MTNDITTTRKSEHPAILWLRDSYLPTVGGNMSQAARDLGISSKTLSGLIRGTYQGDVDGQLAKLTEQQTRLEARITSADIDLAHIPTELLRRCWGAFEAAKQAHLCNYICGKSQIGKTTAAEAYKGTYPDTTVFFRMPTRPTISSLIRHILKAARLPRASSAAEGMERLCEHLSPRNLIIADEVHLALSRRQGIDALDILRELYDRTGCGLVLIVTDIGGREIVNGAYHEQLAQLEKRGEWEMLPEVPSSEDVRTIFRAYGLTQPEPETWQTICALVRSSCFGQFVHRLKMAVVLAKQQDRPVTWDDFVTVASRMGRRPE